jgi:hypothetical protein
MRLRFGVPIGIRCLLAAWFALITLPAVAHTLPISYLQLVPAEDYLHAELLFNPFELRFMPELDDNKDAELDLKELAAHGQMLADRVAGALKLSVGGKVLRPETVGMDPDLSGHHVRMRAHYKVDARRVPLTVETELSALTSSSHLTQVTYVNGGHQQLAQLDSQSRKVTFQPPGQGRDPMGRAGSKRGAVMGLALLAATAVLVVIGIALLWSLRMQRPQ